LILNRIHFIFHLDCITATVCLIPSAG